MNEQIVLTKNDNGIEIEAQFVNDKKKPVDITGLDIEINIKYPDNSVVLEKGYVIDHKDGRAGFMLEKKNTEQIGLYSMYWSCIEDGYLTTQEAIYYYVLEKFGQ